MVSPGTVLVEGTWTGDRFVGTAYAFKQGCPPEPYPVSGAKVERPGQLDLVLRGAGPIRRDCEVVGHSEMSRICASSSSEAWATEVVSSHDRKR